MTYNINTIKNKFSSTSVDLKKEISEKDNQKILKLQPEINSLTKGYEPRQTTKSEHRPLVTEKPSTSKIVTITSQPEHLGIQSAFENYSSLTLSQTGSNSNQSIMVSSPKKLQESSTTAPTSKKSEIESKSNRSTLNVPKIQTFEIIPKVSEPKHSEVPVPVLTIPRPFFEPIAETEVPIIEGHISDVQDVQLIPTWAYVFFIKKIFNLFTLL